MNEYRKEIDDIDNKIIDLFLKRFEIVKKISDYKKNNNINIEDIKRENEIIDKIKSKVKNEKMSNYFVEIYKKIFEISKKIQ